MAKAEKPKAAGKKPAKEKVPAKKKEPAPKKTKQVPEEKPEKEMKISKIKTVKPVPKALSLTVHKIKLEKNDVLYLEATKIDSEMNEQESKILFSAPIHVDLKSAFSACSVHMALMCDMISTKQLKSIDAYDPELVAKFSARSISIKDGEGLTISGNRKLVGGKVFNLTTPYWRFEEAEETRYRYMDDLMDKLEILRKEVVEFLNGKHGPKPDPELPFGDGGEMDEEGLKDDEATETMTVVNESGAIEVVDKLDEEDQTDLDGNE